MPVTIKDIARELGISASTVSRVLNGKSSQNKVLIERVKEKAKELNYQVNTAAAGLRTNKTKLIGIVVPEINNEFFSEILSGMEEASEEAGYNLLICQSRESAKREKKLIKSLISCNVEGLLISTSIENHKGGEVNDEIFNTSKKVVFFDRIPSNTSLPYVTINDFDGTYKVTKHLLDQGRKFFVFYGFSPELNNNKERLRGVITALNESGIVDLKVFYEEGTHTLDQIVSAGNFDAIVCYNDHCAAKALNVLKKMKISVPEQVALSGFDNRALCELVSPTLTTVTHSASDMGRKAIKMLLGSLDSEQSMDSIVLPAEIIVRESTSVLAHK